MEGAWNYQLSPGVLLNGSVVHQNEQGELSGSDDLVGWLVTTSILLSF